MAEPFDWFALAEETTCWASEARIQAAADDLRTRIEAAFVPVERYEAERLRMAETMQRMTSALEARAEAAEAENVRLREALKWYADNPCELADGVVNVCIYDDGERARQALGAEHER